MQAAQFQLHAAIEQRHWWFVGRREIVAGLVEPLCSPGGVLLDVGCGTGANAAGLADRYAVQAMDTSADAIRLATERFPSVRFHHADVLDPAVPLPEGLEVVLLLDVLEHIADDAGFLAGLIDRLAPGTHVIVTVPARPDLWSPHDEAFGHHRRYTAATLAATWEDLPVQRRLLSPFCSLLFPAIWAVRTALRPWHRTTGAADTDFRTLPGPLNRTLLRVFAHERRRLRGLLSGEGRPYPAGSSLVAVLTKEAA